MIRGTPRDKEFRGDCHETLATARCADASRRREAGLTMLKGLVGLVIEKVMAE